MKTGDKFNRLTKTIDENTSYQLNASGIQLLKEYHSIINEIEEKLLSVISKITKDPNKMSKQLAVQLVSIINSNKEGNDRFELMSRLDILTNGGKTHIQGHTFTFSPKDTILQYLEKT